LKPKRVGIEGQRTRLQSSGITELEAEFNGRDLR
jgi:hypothetical protein